MKKLFTLMFITGVLINVSCVDDNSNETVSWQPEINHNLNMMSSEEVLILLGQPNNIMYDTIADIPIMKFCYTDSVMLYSYRTYSKANIDEPVFVDVYFKEDSVYSVKTNMLKPIPLSIKRQTSMIGLPTALFSLFFVFLLVAVICWIQMVHSIKNDLIEIKKYLYLIKESSWNIREDINKLTTKANKFDCEVRPAIKSLSYTIENGLDSVHAYLTMLKSAPTGAEGKAENLPLQTEISISGNEIDKDLKHFLDTDIELSNLPTSVKNVLRYRTNLRKMGKLCTLSNREIMGIVGLGAGARHRIVDEFKRYGLSLGTDLSDYGYPRKDPEIEGSIRHITKLTV